MNTKLFIFLGLLLISFSSASIDFENNTYEIDTWIPNWLGGDGYSNVTLIQNTDQCLVDCSFTLEGYNEEPVNLIDDIKFVDNNNKDISSKLQSINFKLESFSNSQILCMTNYKF